MASGNSTWEWLRLVQRLVLSQARLAAETRRTIWRPAAADAPGAWKELMRRSARTWSRRSRSTWTSRVRVADGTRALAAPRRGAAQCRRPTDRARRQRARGGARTGCPDRARVSPARGAFDALPVAAALMDAQAPCSTPIGSGANFPSRRRARHRCRFGVNGPTAMSRLVSGRSGSEAARDRLRARAVPLHHGSVRHLAVTLDEH